MDVEEVFYFVEIKNKIQGVTISSRPLVRFNKYFVLFNRKSKNPKNRYTNNIPPLCRLNVYIMIYDFSACNSRSQVPMPNFGADFTFNEIIQLMGE